MKRIILATIAVLALAVSSCGGSQSVASGVEDSAKLCATAVSSYPVTITVDGQDFNVKTIKVNPAKVDRNINATAANSVRISTGKHEVVVTSKDGRQLYKKTIFVSTGETKILEL